MKRLRVVHVVASIDDEAAGPSVSVPSLAEAQAQAGLDVEIATVEAAELPLLPQRRLSNVEYQRYARSLSRVPIVSRLAFSHALKRSLVSRSNEIDIVHGHGLWLMPNVYPAVAARAGRARYVLAPRGMLGFDALNFSKIRKQVFWNLAQKRAVKEVALIHATSGSEIQDVRNFGLLQPVVLAPNGINVKELIGPRPSSVDGSRTILSLGRVHPKKGLDRLVRAFSKIEAKYPEWRLRIIGPSELGHAEELLRLRKELCCSRVYIEGPLYGSEKRHAYRAADIFVLPSLHENFAMTVAEALAAGTPVISTVGAPWEGLVRENCGLWIPHGAEAMAAALERLIMSGDVERAKMGARGRAWMERDFSWDSVASQITEAYLWLLNGGDAPSSIHTTARYKLKS